MICLFDTETTGLLLPEGAPLANQPRIIEFAAIKINPQLEEVGRLEFMCNPGLPLPAIITKITGITDKDLYGKLMFDHYISDLIDFFSDVDIVVAHNVNYDMGMLSNELRRNNSFDKFPWPSTNICTIEATYHIHNRRMKLEQAYEHFCNKPVINKHRAMGDVETLLELTKKLVEEGLLCLSTSKTEVNTPSKDASVPSKKSSKQLKVAQQQV
jgi:DNA polymerase III epsilon subunit-like protein